MRFPEYDHLDALALGELVARGRISAAEALEAALERADLRNGRVNAIVARYDDEARARARGPLPAGPLSGVPFLVKDLLAAWRGHPLTGSSRFLAGLVADRDSEVVRRLLAAGLVLFGQTNTPELGIMGTTEPRWRGPTRNPWDVERSAGGSSGGAAAAVAARVVPAAHGNDTGGSLRIPASACGILGVKPTRGRVSLGPAHGELNSGLTVEGIVSRSVRDAAALLDLLGGPAPGDPHVAPPPSRPFLSEVGLPPGRLRIAFTPEPLLARVTNPECAAAVKNAARLLADLGHEVVEARPALPRERLARAYLVAVAAQTAVDVERGTEAVGRRPGRDDLEPGTAALAAAGRTLTARDLALAAGEMHAAARTMGAFHERHDVFVTPTTAQPPLPLGAVLPTRAERIGLGLLARFPTRRGTDALLAVAARSFDATGNTMPFNQTGQPALSVPLHWTPDGLPVGVQLVARFGDEATLFRLAAQLEQARPWAERLPPGIG